MAKLDIIESNLEIVLDEHDLVYSGRLELKKNRSTRKFKKETNKKPSKILRVGLNNDQISELFSGNSDEPKDLHLVLYENDTNSGSVILNKKLPEITSKQIRGMQSLTKCELKTLERLAEYLKYRDIADKRFVSLDTVKGHIYNIYRKLDVHNRHQATKIYLAYLVYLQISMH
jgi:DNA-binding NarL/FixJ family response regulator